MRSYQEIISKSVTLVSHLWPLPVLYYFYTYGRFTTNVPFGDDITLIIGRTANFLAANDLWSGLPYLFNQSEEYRVPFIALSGIISTKLLGYINFSFIGLVGNAGLFIAFFIAVYSISTTVREFRVLATITFLLLASPVFAGCMLWTNCTIGHFGSILCGMVACLFLSRSGLVNFVWFELALLIAIFTHGNGVVLLPLGFVGLWFCQHNNQERKTCMFIHAIICLFVFMAVFMTFDKNTAELLSEYTLSSMERSPLAASFLIIKWTLAWTGSWASFENSVTTAIVVGSVQLVFIAGLFLTKRRTLLQHYGLPSLMTLFLVLTIASASLMRSQLTVGIEHIFTDRFRVYSLALLICLIYLVIVLVRDGRFHAWTNPKNLDVIFLALILASSSYFLKVNYDKQPYFVAFKSQQIKCAGDWALDGMAKPCTWHGDNKIVMDRAIAMGILHINKNGMEPLRCQEPYLKYCWK